MLEQLLGYEPFSNEPGRAGLRGRAGDGYLTNVVTVSVGLMAAFGDAIEHSISI